MHHHDYRDVVGSQFQTLGQLIRHIQPDGRGGLIKEVATIIMELLDVFIKTRSPSLRYDDRWMMTNKRYD